MSQQKFDTRTPGLFKLEWEWDSFVGLCSKTYYCFGSSKKQVSKGINIAQNPFSEEHYIHVLQNQESGLGKTFLLELKTTECLCTNKNEKLCPISIQNAKLPLTVFRLRRSKFNFVRSK